QQVSLVGEERTLKGSYMGSSIPSRDIPRYVALHRAGRLPIEKLLTSRGPLEEINEALDALADGSAIRHIIDLYALSSPADPRERLLEAPDGAVHLANPVDEIGRAHG